MNEKKTVAGVLFLALATVGFCADDARSSAKAHDELIRGVSAIDSEGLSGQVLPISPRAFQIGEARNWSGTATGAGAGMFYGRGRAIYLGHPNYLCGAALADTEAFLKNAVVWLAKGKRAPKVVVIKNNATAAKFRALGFDVAVAASIAGAGNADVVVSGEFRPADAATYIAYVEKGGGLLGAGLGWGWKQITGRTSKNVSLAKHFGDNLVFAPLGCVMGDMGTPKPAGAKHFPLKAGYPKGVHLLEALDVLAADEVPPSALWKQCVETVALALAVTPASAFATHLKAYPAFAAAAAERATLDAVTPQQAESLALKAAGRRVVYRPYPAQPHYCEAGNDASVREPKSLYLGVSLVDLPARIEEYKTRDDIPGGEKDNRWKTDWLLLRRIDVTGKTVTLGWPDNPGCRRDVELSRPYYIGVYEVTQKQWQRVTGERADAAFAASACADVRPVTGVSYDRVRGSTAAGADWPKKGAAVGIGSFLADLRDRVDGKMLFDLPSEAEWEVAARSGSTNRWNDGSGSEPYKVAGYNGTADRNLDRLARYCQNGGEFPNGKAAPDDCGPDNGSAPVGRYAPSLWGLYDMHGNVYELCRDYYTEDIALISGRDPAGGREPQRDYRGQLRPRRVQKGGSYWNFVYGGAGNAAPGQRRFGPLIAPSTGHGATGFRVMVPAQILSGARDVPGKLGCTAAQAGARARLLKGVGMLLTEGFPSPLACLSKNAFPLIAGKDQWGNQLIVAAAAEAGKGRVVLFGEESLLDDGNSAFVRNARAWLAHGGRAVKVCDFRGMDKAACAKLVREVKSGLGLLAVGCAWKWRGEVEEKTGMIPPLCDYPANRTLMPLGLAILDGGALHTAAFGYSARAAFTRGVTVWDAAQMRAAGVYCDAAEESRAMKTLRDAAELKADTGATPGYSPAETVLPKAYPACENGTRVRSGDGIVFIGDSITRLGGGKDGWIDRVLAGLAEKGVTNIFALRAGWDGQTSGDMLARFEKLVTRPGIRWVSLSCGVNDVWGFDWQRGVMLPDYKRNVRRMLDIAAKHGVNVVLLTPTLVGEDPARARNRILAPYADFIRAEAKKRGLLLADVNRAEIEGLEKLPVKGVKHFTYDGVHPVAAGHELFARTVLKAFGQEK